MSKYEGHTPGPWKWKVSANWADYEIVAPSGNIIFFANEDDTAMGDIILAADAPMLAERVEELEEQVCTLEAQYTVLHRKRNRLAEQNEKMLAMFKKIESMYAKGDERFMYTEMHEICALIAEIEEGV
jgi:DNA-binding LytR/AlgR family response regulator